MDLPPPPPQQPHHFLHQSQPHQHYYHLRHEGVLHPPDFRSRPYFRNIPPPPPLQSCQSHTLLPPLPPPPPQPHRRMAHPPLPSRSNFSPHRSHHYEIVLPPKPYPDRRFHLPPPPPLPEPQDYAHLRFVHDYPPRNPILADDIIRRAPDLGNRERYPSNFCGSQEFYSGGEDLVRRQVNRGRDLYDERRAMNWASELHKVDFNETRKDSIKGWICGLYKDRDRDDWRTGSGVSNRGRKLSCEGGDDERSWNHGSNDDGLLRSEKRQPECMENASSLARITDRLGSGVVRNFVRSKKKRKVKGNVARHKIHLVKNCSSGNGGHKYMPIQREPGESSFEVEKKEGFEYLQTRIDGDREGEKSLELAISFKSNALVAKAILGPPCPDIKTDINSSLVKTESTSSKSGLRTVKSSEDADKSEIAVENQTPEILSLEGHTSIGSADTHQSRFRKKRKTRKRIFLESNVNMKRDKSHIICTSLSASIQPISDTALPNISDSCKSLGPNLKRKIRSLTALSASLYVADSVISDSLVHAERLETSTEGVDAENYVRVTLLDNESTSPVDNPGFNQHGNDMNRKISVFDAQRTKMDCIAQCDNLCADRVDDINEHPSLENSFANGPSKVMSSLDGNAVAGLSHKSRSFSEILASSASLESNSSVHIRPENGNYADSRSKDIFMNEVNTPQVVVDSKEYRSLEGVSMPHYSDIISTSTDILAARYGEIIGDGCSPNDLKKKASIDDTSSVEGSLEAPKNDKTCLSIDYLSNATMKRKAWDAQMGFLDTDGASSVSTSDEVGRVLAKVPDPAMETELLGERGSFQEVDKSSAGPSRVEHRTLELDFDPNGLYHNYSKKRKVASPKSNLSSFSEDEMVADGLSADCSKLYQGSTGLADSKAEKNADSAFSRDFEPVACQSDNEMICGRESVPDRKPVSSDLILFPSGNSLPKVASEKPQNKSNLSHSLPEANQVVVKKLNQVHGGRAVRKNQLIPASPKVFPGDHPFYFNNSRKLQHTQVAKSRTWHRNGSSLVAVAETKLQPSPCPQSHGTETDKTLRSSYIRKGNSLVRNPSAVVSSVPHHSSRSVYRLTPSTDNSKDNSLVRIPSPPVVTSGSPYSSRSVYRLTPCTDDLKDTKATVSKTGKADAQSAMRTEPVNIYEMPYKTRDALEERMKTPGVLGLADSGISSNNQGTLAEGNPQKIMYVKRRSNQLIAASTSGDMSTLGVDKKGQTSSSDGYYKRKNQVVSENHGKKGDAHGNSLRIVTRAIHPRCTRQQSRIAKHSKLSFVWKLQDMQCTESLKPSVAPQKVVPRLFSWKRGTYRRSFKQVLSTKSNKSSFSSSRQTLLFSRKRGAIYTRSTRGYSLRMFKVLSVGGSSLKWSKAIEKNSKKANEEATWAVAAAEKRKNEENGAAHIASKSRYNVSRKLVLSVQLRPGERIFRIGSERYKMDPTRRTLHRITAVKEASSPVVLQTGKNGKRSYVPRRLLIGNEEYVRIGNGNQLVRDPKKRIRVLASEKIRWSLRTARLRMARLKKFCQFFTRFGKCNKDDGKCPYIHDPSKIAVCTKFLNGSCSNLDCKLTHKVIPERMEDCSYYLKGSCSNENCPYRHVNVDPDSTVCESFLRGYCADGNECRKKHSYVCPTYEATGLCPNLSSCKLHHPRKKTEKQLPSTEQKTLKGRYFDGGLLGDADVSDTPPDRALAPGKDEMVLDCGKYPDYISLDVEDDEMDLVSESDEQIPDFDVLV